MKSFNNTNFFVLQAWSTKKHVCLSHQRSALKLWPQFVGLYPDKNVQRKNSKFVRPSLPRIAKRYWSANHAQYAFLNLLPEPSRIGNDCDSHLFYTFKELFLDLYSLTCAATMNKINLHLMKTSPGLSFVTNVPT